LRACFFGFGSLASRFRGISVGGIGGIFSIARLRVLAVVPLELEFREVAVKVLHARSRTANSVTQPPGSGAWIVNASTEPDSGAYHDPACA
jgi:hypothetical protein